MDCLAGQIRSYMADLSSQTIHACFAIATQTQSPARFAIGEYTMYYVTLGCLIMISLIL